MWVVFFYTTISFITDNVLISASAQGKEWLVQTLLSLFNVLELLSFAFIIYAIIPSRLLKKYILFLALAFTVFCISFFLLSGSHVDKLAIPATIKSILLILFCLAYLFSTINKPQVYFIYMTPQFWIVFGILTYITGTFFVFILIGSLNPTEIEKYWYINHVFNTVKNVFFAISFLIKENMDQYAEIDNSFDNFIKDNPHNQ